MYRTFQTAITLHSPDVVFVLGKIEISAIVLIVQGSSGK